MTARPAILITGAARRVGAELAMHFAHAGYDIGLHYHRSRKDAEKLAAKIEREGVHCVLFNHDLQQVKTLKPFMDRVLEALPRCRGLINNASIFERASFMETDEALFDRQFAVNFKAPFFLTQAFAHHFGKGSVINILDTEIQKTHGSHFAYLLSKKALMDLTLMSARELGPNIRVNGICPGIMLPSNELDQAYMDKLARQVPMRKLGTLEQVADAALWLAQSHVTGQLVFIDGGQHLL